MPTFLPLPFNMNDIQGGATDSVGPHFLVIGRVRKPHGVRGDVRVEVHTDLPERFSWLETVWVGENNPQPVAVESARLHGQMVLLKLAGYDGREAAKALNGQWLQVPASEAIPLAEGEYFLYQLEGLAVFTDDGVHLGQLTQVVETGANNVFVVQREGAKDVLLPDTDEVVRTIDFENGRMIVHLLPGLLP